MKDRIKKIMEMQHITQQEFADQLKIAPATLSSIFTGRTRPTLAIVDAIKARFPQVSTDWLMFGKGEMLEKQASVHDSSDVSDGEQNDLLNIGVSMPDSDNVGGVGTLVSADAPAEPKSAATVADNGATGMSFRAVDNRQRRITEIRVFYDDQTWETFVPSV